MKKENFEAWMKEQNRILKKQGVKEMPPKCSICGTPMINDIDPITKRISKYLWKTNCEHLKDMRLSIG